MNERYELINYKYVIMNQGNVRCAQATVHLHAPDEIFILDKDFSTSALIDFPQLQRKS